MGICKALEMEEEGKVGPCAYVLGEFSSGAMRSC